MGNSGAIKTTCKILFVCILLLHLTGFAVLAEEGGAGDWRPVYDTIMLYVNFLILAYLLYRYGRQPFMQFLQSQKLQVSESIQKVEDRKEKLLAQINETQSQMQESSERYAQIKQRIIEEGQRVRQQIIDDAKEQSKIMIEREKKNASRRLMEARKDFMTELVDTAANLARNRLPEEITENDQDKLIDFYVASVNRMSG
ncbi:MAG: ATP synthase F0 subunit B [Desulfobacterales bacterium]|nr:ATP synthase F0 subunit B [Desulfobacterales bacterium]